MSRNDPTTKLDASPQPEKSVEKEKSQRPPRHGLERTSFRRIKTLYPRLTALSNQKTASTVCEARNKEFQED